MKYFDEIEAMIHRLDEEIIEAAKKYEEKVKNSADNESVIRAKRDLEHLYASYYEASKIYSEIHHAVLSAWWKLYEIVERPHK
jgi:hypothetical protein